MLKKIKELFADFAKHVAGYEGKRSSQWSAVRAKFLQDHPKCSACGGTKSLNVHHIHPFEYYPELELDAEHNLITLCEDGPAGMNCHFVFGHCGASWMHWNPRVIYDAERVYHMHINAIKGRIDEHS